MQLETISCPLCSSKEYIKAMTSFDISVSRTYFDICRCRKCGFHFTNPRPVFESINAFYGDSYYSYRSPKARVPKDIKKNYKKFLDIGCGAGEFLIEKRNQGYECYGIDIDKTAIERARDLGLEVQITNSKSIDFPDNFFDKVRLNHVLEHIHFLQKMLAEILRCLKDEGRLIAEVPNIASYDAKIYGHYWRYLDVPRHLYHFDPVSIKVLLEKNGFQGISIKTHNTPILNKRLYYLKGSYTIFKLINATNKNNMLKAGAIVLRNICRYAFHRSNALDGNLISIEAHKK